MTGTVPRNFVIVFRGREGSSALIDLLGKHPQIQVPVFEQLDHHEARHSCPPDRIARLVALTYATGDRHEARALLDSGGDPPEPPPDHAVGFKWRIWGQPDQVVQALADHEVTVFHLFRLRLRELIVSFQLTDIVLPELHRAGATDLPKGGHLQFELAAMPEEQRAELRRRLAALRFRLDPDRFRAAAQAELKGKRLVLETYLRPLRQLGVPVRAILYEDLCDNRAALLRSLCGAIGVDPAPLRTAETWYQKVHASSPSLQVENWDELNADRELRDIAAAWRDLIFKEHSYLGPTRATAGQAAG